MTFHRWDPDRPRTSNVTVGEVFVAVSREPFTRSVLGEIHRKLFEGAGVRQGSSPEHFIYVTPSKARTEINGVAAWIGERFGAPGSTVPARTPFGYISGPWDGWITLFAALLYSQDQSLASDFVEAVAGLTWSSSGGRSRYRTSPGDTAQPCPPQPCPPSPISPPPPAPREAPGPTRPGFFSRLFRLSPEKNGPPPREQGYQPPPYATYPQEREQRSEPPRRTPPTRSADYGEEPVRAAQRPTGSVRGLIQDYSDIWSEEDNKPDGSLPTMSAVAPRDPAFSVYRIPPVGMRVKSVQTGRDYIVGSHQGGNAIKVDAVDEDMRGEPTVRPVEEFVPAAGIPRFKFVSTDPSSQREPEPLETFLRPPQRAGKKDKKKAVVEE